MGLYKVNRRIVHNHKPYNPGSQIELSDREAKQMKNGQITAVPQKPVAAPAEPVAPPQATPETTQKKPAVTGTDEKTAPVK